MSEDDKNLLIWNKLATTNPVHTKKFQRAGGFKGTAIKPIYTTLKMTEQFGPAGQGWGMGEPTFQTVEGSEGQVAVFCTVALWYRQETTGQLGTAHTVHTVYGVGGDMVVVKQSAGLRTDDEAFKKAFTDAIGNAMKHLGMSADVHMGLFDDNKYVQEVTEEFSAPARTEPAPQLVKVSRESEKALRVEIDACRTAEELKALWNNRVFQAEFEKLHETYRQGMIETFNERYKWLKDNPATIPPNFDNLQP